MRSLLLAAASAIAILAVACAEAPSDGTPGTGDGPDCALTPYATGCQSSSGKQTEKPTQTNEVTETEDRTCKAKTCEDFDGACGEHEDGCGAKFSCGDCAGKDPDCRPKTCDDLDVSCGTHDNGCGGTTSCGACATACATDGKEPNDTKAQAVNLGKFADTEDKKVTVSNLASADGDEDWFKFEVQDAGFGGNPLVEVTATDAKLEVSVFHECKSLPNFSFCEGPGKQDNALGFGCSNPGKTTLKTDCKGISEDGQAWVRVRKTASDKACHSYDLTVYVH